MFISQTSVSGNIWLYCPDCGERHEGAGPSKCARCGGAMRIWKDPEDKPPPEDVSTIPKMRGANGYR